MFAGAVKGGGWKGLLAGAGLRKGLTEGGGWKAWGPPKGFPAAGAKGFGPWGGGACGPLGTRSSKTEKFLGGGAWTGAAAGGLAPKGSKGAAAGGAAKGSTAAPG